METSRKKRYEKPQLQEVKLVPEEAVLAACKTADLKNARGCRSNRCGNTNRNLGTS